MTKLENKIYEAFSSNPQYTLSSDVNIKSEELKALKNLEENGFIQIKLKTIGYYIAEVL